MNNNKSGANQLWRTNVNEKKTNRYFSTNGQGRDGYILNTSFGQQNQEGFFKVSNPSLEKPSYSEKRLKYFPDGSGRDAYITQNSGGLFSTRENDNPKASFFSNFRAYETRGFSPRYVMVTPQTMEIKKKQYESSKQLSQPKIIDQAQLSQDLEMKFKLKEQKLKKNQLLSKLISSPSNRSFSPSFQNQFADQNSKYQETDTSQNQRLVKLPSIHLPKNTIAF